MIKNISVMEGARSVCMIDWRSPKDSMLVMEGARLVCMIDWRPPKDSMLKLNMNGACKDIKTTRYGGINNNN